MNTKQKIAFLLADYAVRVIAGRDYPILTELPLIQSVTTANAAFAASHDIFRTHTRKHSSYNTAYYAANTASYAIHAKLNNKNATYLNNAYRALCINATLAAACNTTFYRVDIRALINIAINEN